MLTFLEWVSQLKEGYLTPMQGEGDDVFFGIHSLSGPIDVKKMRHCISPIRSVGKNHVLVERPQKTRHRGMKKMMSKDTGLLKIATGSLHKVPDEMVIGGDGAHKLFMYMPGDYHKGMARKLDKKMMAADTPAAQVTSIPMRTWPNNANTPQTQQPQAQQTQQPQAQQTSSVPMRTWPNYANTPGLK